MSERELVRLVGDGDPRGQRELYDRYAPFLTALASRYLGGTDQVKDLLQDVFIKVFDRFRTFRYRGEGSLKAWLSKIVVNEALHLLRKSDRMLPVENLPEPDSDEDPDVDEVPLPVLQDMISRLPDGYRTVFNLYVFEQMRHKDIAALLGIKENSSASQLLRAKAMLAKEIKEYKYGNGR
ncbi:MAG: sigma-70 family RNA polymerase sigma factor [Bacteroidales bacterium]|nr:sigma-70 family RNA polymerase sigma factor [Bacteroidales bacterium]